MTIAIKKGRTEQSIINKLRRKGFVVTTIHKLDNNKYLKYGMHKYRVFYHKKRR